MTGSAGHASPFGMTHRLGIDIGGTFTDYVLYDEQNGGLSTYKHLTTPGDILTGLVEGLERFLMREGVPLAAVREIRHGTTLCSNVVIERKGPKTALITTRGFRDILLIQRAYRYHMYDLHIRKPTPLVPRELIFEITERVTYDGNILAPLDEDDARRAAATLSSIGVVSVAVVFLHSYANPSHERRVRDILLEHTPGLLVSVSSDISLQAREYERTSTTVTNAYIRPVVAPYLARLTSWVQQRGFRGQLQVMQCNGGLVTGDIAEQYPVRMIESGPAAGAIAAIHYGGLTGASDLIGLDMGGTTAKACLIERSQPIMVEQLELAPVAMRVGSGLPIDVPAIDLVEIGAGGGSIARPHLGTIRVGPESAGADPGPICYGRGGIYPTVTDANLVLGYLSPSYFLGGSMPLDDAAAVRGLEEHLGRPLGLSAAEAAWGVHQIVTAAMAQAVRMVSVARGKDPRLFTLFASGGAGPTHACRLARELGIKQVILPAQAGVASAIGLLAADSRFDLSRTFICRLDEENIAGVITTILSELRQRLLDLAEMQPGTAPAHFLVQAHMRYLGQAFDIPVPVTVQEFEARGTAALVEMFQQAYRATYGENNDQEPVEGVHWRMSLVRPSQPVAIARWKRRRPPEGAVDTLEARRRVYFAETGGYIMCPVYNRALLAPGDTLVGPAVVQDPNATTVLLPHDHAAVDDYGNLNVTIAQTNG